MSPTWPLAVAFDASAPLFGWASQERQPRGCSSANHTQVLC